MTIYEYRGIRKLMCAEVLTDTSTGITFGTPFELAGVAELTRATETSEEAHYYDNVPAIVIDSTGSDEVTITSSALSLENMAKITGQIYDESKGMFVEGEPQKKYFAIGYVTKRTDGTEIFVWRLKGKFGIPDTTHVSEDDGTDANGQELTFTGINTTAKFELSDGDSTIKKTVKAVNVDTSVNNVGEDTFFATVQTPATITA